MSKASKRREEVKRAQKHHAMEVTKHYSSRGLEIGVGYFTAKVIAQELCMNVVVVPDANGVETTPYYCIPHEAPR